MERPTRKSKDLAAFFSTGKTMETSKLVRGTEVGNKRNRKAVYRNLQEVLPSSSSIFSDLTGLPTDLLSSSAFQADLAGPKPFQGLHDSKNIGFQLLKKSGWTEGSGLGIAEQGRLNPLEAELKLDRRGIGAEKKVKRKNDLLAQDNNAKKTKKEKNLAKKVRKMKAEAEKMEQQAFERDFYREFWPVNV